LVLVGVCVAVSVIKHYPTATDAPLSATETKKLVDFYTNAYSATPKDWQGTNYVDGAQASDEHHGTTDDVKRFVRDYHLENAKVVDIGSGRGQLQDVVTDYTGIDIAPTAGRFYHKPFFAGSATALPFSDSTFDSAWSILCMEHIPNPEQAFAEMRRVTKNGGLLYIVAAWNVPTWAADGYDIRPYGDLSFTGKLSKASLLVRASRPYTVAYRVPVRFLRYMSSDHARLHYTRLTPNYKAFWNDSDAVNSIDRYEAALWFLGHGDECMSCSGAMHGIVQRQAGALVIRVHK
jgi:SAM-dependent methyltransferase